MRSSIAATRRPWSKCWGKYAGVPVYNGLPRIPSHADAGRHPDDDEHTDKRSRKSPMAFMGDGRFNMRLVLVTGALLGMDARIVHRRHLWPDEA